jgi:hypothetical protein
MHNADLDLARPFSLVDSSPSHIASRSPRPPLIRRPFHTRALIQQYRAVPIHPFTHHELVLDHQLSTWDCYVPVFRTLVDFQLPQVRKHRESIAGPGAGKLSAGAYVLAIPGTCCLSYASTATINPNIPRDPFKASREQGYCAIRQLSWMK